MNADRMAGRRKPRTAPDGRSGPFFRVISFCEHRSLWVIAAVAALTLAFGVSSLRIRVDSEVLRLLPQDSDVTRQVEQYAGEAKDTDYLIVVLTAEDPFSLGGLTAIEQFTGEAEALAPVQGSITPLNLTTLERGSRSPLFRPLADGAGAPRTVEEAAAYRERAITDPLARSFVLSEDGSSFALLFAVTVLDDYGVFLHEVQGLLPALEEHYEVRLAGWIPLHDATRRYIVGDPPRLILAAVIVTLCVFFIGFRSIRALVLPMVVIATSLVWVLGIMALFGAPLTVFSIVIPPLLFVLGSSYSIHILNEYYRAETPDPYQTGVAASITRVSRTVTVACATTAIGFASLLLTSIPRMREFGAVAGAGILICGALSLVLYPSVLTHLKSPPARRRERTVSGPLSRLMRRVGDDIGTARPYVLAGLLVVSALFAVAVGRVAFQTDYTTYFRKTVPALEDNRFYMAHFGSFVDINITMTAPDSRPRYFADPAVLAGVSEFERAVAEDPDVSTVLSFLTYLKAVNFATRGEYELPDAAAPVHFLSRVVRGVDGPAGDFIGSFVGSDLETLTIRMTVYDGERKSFLSEEGLRAVVERIEDRAHALLPAETAPEVWSWNLVGLELSRLLARDQVISTVAAAVVVGAVASAAFGSLLYGALSLVPLGFGIMLNFVFIWAIGMPLDVLTIMFTSVAIGLGVDDSVHLLYEYRRCARAETVGAEAAGADAAGAETVGGPSIVSRALERTGRPIVLTSAAIITGLSALTFSSFAPVLRFGVLISFTLFATTLGAVLVLPSLLDLFRARSGIPTRSKS